MLDRLTDDERAMLKQLSRALATTHDFTVITMMGAGVVAMVALGFSGFTLAEGTGGSRVPALAALALSPAFLVLAEVTRRSSANLIYGIRAGGPALWRRLRRILMVAMPTGMIGYAAVITIAISTADPQGEPNWIVVGLAASLGLVANITPVSVYWTMLRYRPFLSDVMYFAAPRVGTTPDALDEFIRAGAFRQSPARRGDFTRADPDRYAAVVAAWSPSERAALKDAMRRLAALPGLLPITTIGLGVTAAAAGIGGWAMFASAFTVTEILIAILTVAAAPVAAVCAYLTSRWAKGLPELVRQGGRVVVGRLIRLVVVALVPSVVVAAVGWTLAIIGLSSVSSSDDVGVILIYGVGFTFALGAPPALVLRLLMRHRRVLVAQFQEPLPREPGCEDALDVFVAEACGRKRRDLQRGPARPAEIVEAPMADFIPGPPARAAVGRPKRSRPRPPGPGTPPSGQSAAPEETPDPTA